MTTYREFKRRRTESVAPRPWARRVRALNPRGASPSPEALQVARDLPSVLARMAALGFPVPAPDLGRQSLTVLQEELRRTTQQASTVANDPTVQQFRKTLHLLLDH